MEFLQIIFYFSYIDIHALKFWNKYNESKYPKVIWQQLYYLFLSSKNYLKDS
jgi:hypothetical protein